MFAILAISIPLACSSAICIVAIAFYDAAFGAIPGSAGAIDPRRVGRRALPPKQLAEVAHLAAGAAVESVVVVASR